LGSINSGGVLVNQDAGINITRIGGGTTTGSVVLGGIGAGQVIDIKSNISSTGTVNIANGSPNVNVNIGGVGGGNVNIGGGNIISTNGTTTITSLVNPVNLLDAVTKKYLLAVNKYKEPSYYSTTDAECSYIFDNSNYIGMGSDPGRLVCNNGSSLNVPIVNLVGKKILIFLPTSSRPDGWKQGIYILESNTPGSWSFIRSPDMNGEIYNINTNIELNGITAPVYTGGIFKIYILQAETFAPGPVYSLHDPGTLIYYTFYGQ
jgi:hypothetical protein